MGAGIAAHLANAGIRTHLLDIVPKGVEADAPKAARNKLAAGALKALPKAKPPALMLKSFGAKITAGNFDDDLDKAVAESDIVIEAIIERLDIKQSVFKKVAAAAGPNCVLATNTSGIPIGDIAEALDESARKRLVGLHFFNPPRWMHLLEVIPSKYTDPAIVEDLSIFSDRTLGKGVVLCRDTPNFIGNRIGIGEMILTFSVTAEGGYTIEEVDTLNAKPVGRPKTGSYRLGDMVGLDVAGHVIRNLRDALSGNPEDDNYDPLFEKMVISPALQTLLDNGWNGDKSGQGFYKKTKERDAKGKKKILSFDLKTGEYRDRIEPDFPELKGVRGSAAAKVAKVMRLEGRAGEFYRKVYLPLFNYSATLTGKICDTPKEIDDAMKWGYGWGMGPFELMDAAGPAWCAEQMKAAGIEPAPAITKLLEQGEGATWYKGTFGRDQQVFDGANYVDVPVPAGMLILGAHKGEGGNEIESNSSAALIDIGDGVGLLEFRSKANVLDEGVVTLMSKAPEILAERGFKALVIGSQDDHFCRGANLLQIGMTAMQKKWDELDNAVNVLQQTVMNLRHGPLPVVVAPYGQTLGGGCEVSLHADHIQASADLFMGLVEIAVGVLPAGGGLKEIARRASEHASQLNPTEVFDWVRRGFEAAATGNVSMSAFEARAKGWLRPTDGITFHKNRVVADAKTAALAIAASNYVPPDRNEPIQVMGAPGGANLISGINEFGWGGFASEHDQLIGKKIIHVLSGGMKPTAGTATAQDLLDLEREAFLSLCGTEKTMARIQHMLNTRKPLRN